MAAVGSPHTAPVAGPPPRATVKEELARCSGWKAGEGHATELRQGERDYLLNFLGSQGSRRVFLVEPAGRRELPSQRERLDLLRRLSASDGAVVLLFVDAAATTRVWGWRRDVAGLWAAERWRVDGRGIPVLPFADPGRAEVVPWSPGMRAGEEAAMVVLWRRCRGVPGSPALLPDGGPPRCAMDLCGAVQGCDDLRTILRLHAQLLRSRLLDPRLDDGDWLTGAMEALVLVSDACLERMQGWLVDAPAGKRHGEVLRRIRRLLFRRRELAEESGVRERLALEEVLLHCLRAVAARSVEAVRFRTRVAGRLGLPQGNNDEAAALADVRIGRWDEGCWTRPDLPPGCGGAGGPHRTAGGVLMEAAALARAEEQLVRMRLEHGTTLGELGEGRRALRRRRRDLYHLLRRCDSAKGAVGRLRAWVEFSGIMEDGGFDLVRSAGAGDGRP